MPLVSRAQHVPLISGETETLLNYKSDRLQARRIQGAARAIPPPPTHTHTFEKVPIPPPPKKKFLLPSLLQAHG